MNDNYTSTTNCTNIQHMDCPQRTWTKRLINNQMKEITQGNTLTCGQDDEVWGLITAMDDVASLLGSLDGRARQVGHALSAEGEDGWSGVANRIHAACLQHCLLVSSGSLVSITRPHHQHLSQDSTFVTPPQPITKLGM